MQFAQNQMIGIYTCLCAHCINPEMKLEALANLTKDTHFIKKMENLLNTLMGLLRE